MKKILFIAHETNRTGAPTMLLYLLKWLKQQQPEINISLLVLKKGALLDDFKAVVDECYELESQIKNSIFKKIVQKLFKSNISLIQKDNLLKQLANQQFDLVYSNTVVAIPYGHKIKSYNNKIKHIAHIHELNVIISQLLPNIGFYTTTTDVFIAPSKLVKENLIHYWDINESKIDVVYECSKVIIPKVKKESSTQFTVGASGMVHWRKGSDIFIQVAAYLKNNHPNEAIKFVWVGAISRNEKIIIEEDIRKTGISDKVFFVGEHENPFEIFNDFNLFLMCSREDPFPLVCIEVGMLGKPIICFENATGSEEIIKKGGGTVVPYLDISAMAEKIIYYKNNPEIVKEQGEINRVEFSKFTPEIICPQILKVIEKYI